jgi:short-subunit dehydrogenase
VIVAGNARPPIDDGAVLITGASAGIGRELAVRLAPRARMLILVARRAGRLGELRASLLATHPRLQVLTLSVDLSDENDVERALAQAGEQAGAVDVLSGTGVVVTQVCPGPVDSEFDQIAGSAGGMTGGPPPFLRISAAQCAREALAGFDRGVPLVFPGRAYRVAMRALPLLPRELSRRQAARSAARIRRTAGDAAHRDRPGGQAGT